jgi:4-hydroxy-tetrahydrodipicolinate reductase
MTKPTRVIQYGLGAIGRSAAQLVLKKQNMQLVGAVDRDPKLVGRDLGEVLGLGKELGVKVSDKPVVLFGQTQADAVIHCTSSSFLEVYDQLVEIVRAGLHCVTSCEEAMFPYYRHHKLAGELDDLCIKRDAAVVGTGVNPGFVMDTLAVVLTAACQRLDSGRVLRVVDASTRREALRRKIGAGLSEEEFHRHAEERKIGHVGLIESVVFMADALGWNLEEVNESIAPVIADTGQVAGVRQFARGVWQGREVLRLELQMYVGAPNPRDEIEITGEPPLKLVIEGGVAGDSATPALLVNTLVRLVEARPGLHTMRTLGLPRIAL